MFCYGISQNATKITRTGAMAAGIAGEGGMRGGGGGGGGLLMPPEGHCCSYPGFILLLFE